MITNTNNVEVLFQELSEEHTASITGGVAIQASSSAEIKTDPTNPTIKSFVTYELPSISDPADNLYFVKSTTVSDKYRSVASVQVSTTNAGVF